MLALHPARAGAPAFHGFVHVALRVIFLAIACLGCTATDLAAQPAAPKIVSVTPPPNGRYVGGDTLTFLVTYDRVVKVNGAPSLPVSVGDAWDAGWRTAEYISGSGSTKLAFALKVEPTDWDGTGIELGYLMYTAHGDVVDAANGTVADLALVRPPMSEVYIVNGLTGVPRMASYLTNIHPKTGTAFSFLIGASGNPTSYMAEGLPPGLQINAVTGVISGTPTQVGVYTIKLSAANSSGSAWTQVDCYVHDASGAPLIYNTNPWTGFVGETFTWPPRISAMDDPTSYRADNLPPGLTLDATTGEVLGTPTVPGEYFVTLYASNQFGTGTAVIPFTIHAATVVTGVTLPPERTYEAGDVLTFSVQFNTIVRREGTDYSAPRPWLAVRFGSGETTRVYMNGGDYTDALQFSCTITTADSGPGVTVERLELNGASLRSLMGAPVDVTFPPRTASGVVIKSVVAPPGAPVVAVQPSADIPTGYVFTYQIQASNSPTSYSAQGLPRGLTLNPGTGLITGVCGSSGPLPHVVTLRATNAAGTGVATQVMTSSNFGGPIEMPVARGIVAPAGGSYKAGDVLTFTISFDVPYGGVRVTGTPRIALTVGSKTRYCTYASSAGDRYPTLTFTYTVAADDEAAQGIALSETIDANGGTIRDGWGLHFVLVVPKVDLTGVRIANAAVKRTQAITWQSSTTAAVGDSMTLDAGSSEGLPVSFELVSGGGSMRDNVLTITAAGPVVVRAFNDGNASVEAASAQVTITAKQHQTIAFASPASGFVMGQPVKLGALSSVGLPITYTVLSGNAVVRGDELIPGAGGPVVVRAASDGNALTFAATADVDFGVAQKAAQFVSFPALADVDANAGSIMLGAVAGSGLPVSYAVQGPARLEGNKVVLTGVAGVVTVTASQSGDASFDPAGEIVRTFRVRPLTQMINLSARARVGSGSASTAIVGFVVDGNAPKRVLVRAVGPGLAAHDVRDILARPQVWVFDAAGAAIGHNDGWADNPVVAAAGDAAGAFRLSPGSRDSALVIELSSGTYTAQVPSSGSGVVLLEVYGLHGEAGMPATPRLVNVSARGYVGDGESSLVAGFVMAGEAPKRVLIRGIGPGLAGFGVEGAVADPTLTLFTSGTAVVVATNRDWGEASVVNGLYATGNAAEIAAAARSVGAFPLTSGSRDSAILITLPPGVYTAVESSPGQSQGTGLIEVYEVP